MADRHDTASTTFDRCRARFRATCERHGIGWSSAPLAARGPHGETLTIDHCVLGDAQPERALVVLSGVHGVEADVNSAIQCALTDRIGSEGQPPGLGVVIVHVVNPWGAAHGRRQNESNVDLNRNWARSRHEPDHNDPYDVIHTALCPDSAEIPDIRTLFATTKPLIREHGEEWVRRAITGGQFRHRDGLHFGGDRTEQSNLVLERSVVPTLARADRVFVVDLHTGHGPFAEITVLSDRPAESAEGRLLRSLFPQVESTGDTSDRATRARSGGIARGIADDLPDADTTVATIEVGTANDLAQLTMTFHEQWAFRCRDLHDPAVAGIRQRFIECFTPNDPEWRHAALAGGAAHLDTALAALRDGS